MPRIDGVQGLWRRRWLRSPAGVDETTHVTWMQAGELHVDLRVPATLDMDAPALDPSRLDPGRVRGLADCEGFAGTTSIDRGVCTWERRINFRGPAIGIDTGTLQWERGGLLETGIHDDYEELWAHEDAEVPSGVRLRSAGGHSLVVLWTHRRFALGRGRPADMAPGPTLGERVERALRDTDAAAIAAAFDQEFCVGRVRDGAGIVERSTLPGRRGAVAIDIGELASGAGRLALSVRDVFGDASSVGFERE